MKSGGIIRFFVCCVLGFSILVYNSVNILGYSPQKEKNQPLTEITFFDDSFNFEEKLQISQNTVNAQNTQNTQTFVEVATGAVKGNIISKYISPYNASLSYDSIYVKNNTSLSPNLKKLLSQDLTFKIKQTNEPQVLIMHTHTTETFMPTDSTVYTENFESRTTDNSRNMARIGEIVSERLNGAGIVTLHDKTQHDYPEYTGSYTRSAKTINSYLKKYPSIKIVLDLHRDAVSSGESDKVKLVTEIQGKKAAQVMLVMGSQSGSVTNYPNWQENFKLAIRLQQKMEKMYPTLARPLMLMSKNYNQSLSNGSLLIEFGTDANSLEEAHYSATLVSDALVSLLNDLK
ncbi:MAG: stage II sporulation protein P [Clostridia bacterium]|nr:stage II sporulation protein P [Clostridia bacterium]